jgi:citrate lyase subunit beta/citryl-CoA lyase
MTTQYRKRRSALYMPGSNARALEKAKTLDADVLIFDLEDAVAPDQKAVARDMVTEAVYAGDYGECEIVIRVNGLDTPWGAEDIAAATEARPDAILLPKVESGFQIADAMCGTTPVWAMIETPRAIQNLAEIAATRVETLVVGINDLAKEMRARIAPGRAAFQTALQLIVLAARAEGKTALDGVWNDIADGEGLAAECAEGAALGFDGKTLIHPSQIEAATRAFSPTGEELAHARAVIAAFTAEPGAGVLKVDGRMTERLHLSEAERIVRLAD